MDELTNKFYKRINWVISCLMITGIIIIILTQVQHFYDIRGITITTKITDNNIILHNDMVAFIDSIGYITLIAGTAFMTGGLVGFLFGVPKVYEQYQTKKLTGSTMFLQSDNMMQISDWLTKTIVGISLTQLHKIPFYFESLGQYIVSHFTGALFGETIAIESIILFYGVGGIGLSYLWSRRYFMRLLQLAVQKSEEAGQQGIELIQKQNTEAKKKDDNAKL